jgi:DNA-binding response OmpR family regulator
MTSDPPSTKHVLVIEDDRPIRRGVVDALQFAGFDVSEADNGDDGLDLATRIDCDLVLLDLMLPGPDGLDILEQVRSSRPELPVIILTARGEERDRVRGLRLGADDYVVKPFSVKELLARVEAVLRRSPGRPVEAGELAFPGGVARFDSREVVYDGGDRCELSERETELLRYFACNPGRAISREEILARVWRIEPRGVETRTIDMHVARLREKLHDEPGDGLIRTVRGKGYLFAAEA